MATEQGPVMITDVEVGWFTDLEKCASEVVSYLIKKRFILYRKTWESIKLIIKGSEDLSGYQMFFPLNVI